MTDKSEEILVEEVKPIQVDGKATVKQLVKSLGDADAFNAGRLFESCELFSKMLHEHALICVTMAGALVPAGMNGPIASMIKKGQIDMIVSTGANLYHDAHMALGRPFYKGDFNADDVMLRKHGIDRVYDVYVREADLIGLDDLLCNEIFPEIASNLENPSTAEFHYELGRALRKRAKYPENSVVIQAYENKVPVFCSSPGDSSIGMDLAKYNLFMEPLRPIKIDVDKDVAQSTALFCLVKKTGILVLGGGSPKNFALQTQPMLEQILSMNEKGHDFVIQFTIDVPQYGGLSGALPNEAISWGKIKPKMRKNLTVVYGDTTISLSILSAFIQDITQKPKRLYDRISEAEEYLTSRFRK